MVHHSTDEMPENGGCILIDVFGVNFLEKMLALEVIGLILYVTDNVAKNIRMFILNGCA